MQLQLHTKAEGKYFFYEECENGQLKLIGESKNIITNAGKEYIKTKKWVECFQELLIGDDDSVPAVGATIAVTSQLGAALDATVVPAANPGFGSYSFGSFPAILGAPVGSNTVTYVNYRSWVVSNGSGGPWTIREVGTRPTGSTDLFSYSVLPVGSQVTVQDGKNIIAMYELRLTTTSCFQIQDLELYIGPGAPTAYQIPDNRSGIVNAPFACLDELGTQIYINNLTTAGCLLFEPSNTEVYGGYIDTTKLTTDCILDFDAKRVNFENLILDGPNIPSNSAKPGTITGYLIKPLGNSPYRFNSEPDPGVGTYEKTYRLTTAPRTGQVYHGLAITTASTDSTTSPAILNSTGWHCIFDTPWSRPANTYLELNVKHTWS